MRLRLRWRRSLPRLRLQLRRRRSLLPRLRLPCRGSLHYRNGDGCYGRCGYHRDPGCGHGLHCWRLCRGRVSFTPHLSSGLGWGYQRCCRLDCPLHGLHCYWRHGDPPSHPFFLFLFPLFFSLPFVFISFFFSAPAGALGVLCHDTGVVDQPGKGLRGHAHSSFQN